jgi:hypothetical protein
MRNAAVLHISWNQYLERWIIKDCLGNNMYELPDCGWFNKIFGKLNKSHENCAIMKVENKGLV